MTAGYDDFEDLVKIDKKNINKPDFQKQFITNKKIIRRGHKLVINFFNELEGFCSKLVDNTYTCDEHIKKDIVPSIRKYVEFQPVIYRLIKNNYKDYYVDGFVSFDKRKLKNIDKFIDKYLKNHKSTIDKIRRDNKY